MVEPESTEPTTDKDAMLKLADEDSAISSFEPSYNEEDAMSILGKTAAEIFAFRVGHKVRLVNRNMDINVVGYTAYGTLLRTFEGTLIIAASDNSGATAPDTIIRKPFTSVITKKVVFLCVPNRQGIGYITRFILQKNKPTGLNIENIRAGKIHSFDEAVRMGVDGWRVF